jgi:hypothetical protein
LPRRHAAIPVKNRIDIKSSEPPPPLDARGLKKAWVDALTDCGPDVQTILYVIKPVADSMTDAVPLIAFAPLQLSVPLLLAEQLEAFSDVHVNVVDCPSVRFVGAAEIDTVGTVTFTASCADSDCEPSTQVRLYV